MPYLLAIGVVVCLTFTILALCGIDVSAALKFVGLGLDLKARRRPDPDVRLPKV